MSELSRSLQPRHVTMISIGGIIGAGLFVGSSASIVATGPAIVLSYLITGTLVLLVMRMLGEMAVALPAVRSFSEFARAGLGPWAGFVAGWLYWYFWIIVVPVEAIAGANILHGWLGLPAWLLGLVLMGVMTGVNLLSARSYGEFEFWFASIKVAAILVFIAFAAAFACGYLSPGGPTFANLTRYGGFVPKGWVSVLAGAVTVYFSLTGAEITTIAAAESREPARAVARMSSSVIVRILTFYVGSVLLIVTVVPWIDVRPGESPFTLALTTMHFPWASVAMSAVAPPRTFSNRTAATWLCGIAVILCSCVCPLTQAITHGWPSSTSRSSPARMRRSAPGGRVPLIRVSSGWWLNSTTGRFAQAVSSASSQPRTQKRPIHSLTLCSGCPLSARTPAVKSEGRRRFSSDARMKSPIARTLSRSSPPSITTS